MKNEKANMTTRTAEFETTKRIQMTKLEASRKQTVRTKEKDPKNVMRAKHK